MSVETKKLEHFTSTILKDAAEQSRQIIEAAQAVYEARIAECEAEIKRQSDRYAQSEIDKIRSNTGRETSQHLMDGKRSLFIKRGEIAIKIATDLRSRLQSWANTPEYEIWLAHSLERCIEKLDCGNCHIVIHCRQKDLPCVKRNMERLRSDNYATEIAEIKIGGVIAVCPDQNMRVDDTLDCAFEDTKDHIAEYIGLRLE